MKILLINNFYFRKGGSETVFFNTAHMLREHGHEVVCFSQKDERNERCPEENYFYDGKGGKLSSVIKYFYNRNASVKLEELLNEFSPNIAHIHLMWGCCASAILKVLNRHNIPVVHTVHDYRMVCPAYVFKTPDGRICERCKKKDFIPCMLHKCSDNNLAQSFLMTLEMYVRESFYNPIDKIDGFIFVSHFSEEKHIQHNPRFYSTKRIVNYNCCNAHNPIDSISKRDYYLYFGRLSKEKGLTTLIDAFKNSPDSKLKIVGTGPLEEQIKTNLPSNIQMCGYMSGNELFSAIASARFVIVPSEWYENNPMSIIESYSFGVPVIASNIGGIPEITPDGVTGFLFDPFHVDGLVQAIKRAEVLSEEDIEVLSRNAIDFYQNHFSIDIHYKNLMNFYDNIISSLH